MTSFAATQTVDASIRIATLRGLYGDLMESLGDPEQCCELWAQILEEQTELADLIPPMITVP